MFRHALLRPVVTVLALAAAALTVTAAHAASGTDIQTRPPKKSNEIMVPIPGWSPEVASNGCHVRRSPEEVLERQPGQAEIPFWGLIAHAVGRHAVQATFGKPGVFLKKIAALDDDLRRLTLLYAL